MPGVFSAWTVVAQSPIGRPMPESIAGNNMLSGNFSRLQPVSAELKMTFEMATICPQS